MDHPRVCGEQNFANDGRISLEGSPPRVRGTAISTALASIRAGSPPRVRGTDTAVINGKTYERITPACAGNRAFSLSPTLAARDHPRVCGEQACNQGFDHDMVGSPPRVRGTGYLSQPLQQEIRITPACAGNRR